MGVRDESATGFQDENVRFIRLYAGKATTTSLTAYVDRVVMNRGPQAFSAYRAAALSIGGGGTDTLINFDSVLFDEGGLSGISSIPTIGLDYGVIGSGAEAASNDGRYRILEPGQYRFEARIQFSSFPADTDARMAFYKNGAVLKRGPRGNRSSAAGALALVLSIEDDFERNDIVDVRVAQFDAGAQAISVGISAAWFSGTRVSDA